MWLSCPRLSSQKLNKRLHVYAYSGYTVLLAALNDHSFETFVSSICMRFIRIVFGEDAELDVIPFVSVPKRRLPTNAYKPQLVSMDPGTGQYRAIVEKLYSVCCTRGFGLMPAATRMSSTRRNLAAGDTVIILVYGVPLPKLGNLN
jgi:hypothetical protein